MTQSVTYPKGHEHRVSYETIYNCIYAQPVGELKRDLINAQRQANNKRVPRSKGQGRRGRTHDMVSTHVRPSTIEDRQFPGLWEGDLFKREANASTVGMLEERTSRLRMLVKLPEVKSVRPLNVVLVFTDKRLSMTYDQGHEMAMHKELCQRTVRAACFCDPHSLWQRSSNENMNGLLRQYLPKGTDLSVYSQQEMDANADEINNRPRKGLVGVRAPLFADSELLANSQQHAALIH